MKVPAAPVTQDTAIAPHHEEDKAPSAFKTISEVAESLAVPQHVLRFWESRFPQIKPLKLRGGRRYYRPQDIDVLTTIKELLYKKGYTIKGAKKAFSQAQHAKPEPIKPARVEPKPALSTDDKKFSQLAVIRQELMGLREVLRPYI